MVKRRILLCRMVKDNLDRTVAENSSRKQNHAADTQNQSQPPEEHAGPERARSTERVQPESQEPTEMQPDFLHWKKFNLKGEPETSCEPVTEADGERLLTHLRPFSSREEYKLVKRTFQQLQHSSYYWGSMTMEEAHKILKRAQLGTFLIRDSGQPDVFFTLSYQSDEGPTSVRVQLNNLLFGLYGSHRTFDSVFALLTYYTSSYCKLTAPYRKQRPERLMQMCRRALMDSYGEGKISTLPGLSPQLKNYLHVYPCGI
ncbi:suppressor of cytokine signaling 1-like [Cottoperca gobio]|uniref:Suppressor of cytokine signaling 1-like n=1 Tax=Cottoperca gobio TaxID=56716 RepID=A0A6J2Q0C1_COTGO|nr:suppressor of cytokine signaling 1-like [Cottoperca gobio]